VSAGDPEAGATRAAGETNRNMWNETAALHERHRFARLQEAFGDPAFSTLDAVASSALARIGLSGKAVAQLLCNNGRELISVERAGAARTVGFDIADAFVDQGRRLAQAARSRAEFVRTDVYDIGAEYHDSFDLVYVTVGALGWLADLPAWYRLVTRLLRSGGHLFIYEMHPILDMFEPGQGAELRHSYFRTEPFVVESAPDYLAPQEVVASRSVWFHHTLGDVIGGALRAGLVLGEFAEHPHDVSAEFKALQDAQATPPLSYHLVARKGAAAG
jgi:SAM-dependent methyltransferase